MHDDFEETWLEREPTTRLGKWLEQMDEISFAILVGSFFLAGLILIAFSICSAVNF